MPTSGVALPSLESLTEPPGPGVLDGADIVNLHKEQGEEQPQKHGLGAYDGVSCVVKKLKRMEVTVWDKSWFDTKVGRLLSLRASSHEGKDKKKKDF